MVELSHGILLFGCRIPWLVVYLPTYPSEKCDESSVGMMIPNWMEGHEIHVLNHQPLRVVPFLEVTSPCFLLFHWTLQFLSASRPYLSIDQSKYHPEIIGWFLAFLGYWNLEPDPFLASRYLGIINYKPSNVGVDDEHFSPGNQEIPWNL